MNYPDEITRLANRDYLCDRCKKADSCKDYTGIKVNKKYHHIYCQNFQEVQHGHDQTT